jgi:hypothetical protein
MTKFLYGLVLLVASLRAATPINYAISIHREGHNDNDCSQANVDMILDTLQSCAATALADEHTPRPHHVPDDNTRAVRRRQTWSCVDYDCEDFVICCRYLRFCASSCDSCSCEGRRDLEFLESETRRLTQPQILSIQNGCRAAIKLQAQSWATTTDNTCLGLAHKIKCYAMTYNE